MKCWAMVDVDANDFYVEEIFADGKGVMTGGLLTTRSNQSVQIVKVDPTTSMLYIRFI